MARYVVGDGLGSWGWYGEEGMGWGWSVEGDGDRLGDGVWMGDGDRAGRHLSPPLAPDELKIKVKTLPSASYGMQLVKNIIDCFL